jgi:hypothetical protein
VPPDARGVFRRLGIDGPFAVLTAENPEGANAEDQPTPRDEARQERANTVRTRTLAAALEAADVDWVPVTGTAPTAPTRSGAWRCACRCATPSGWRASSGSSPSSGSTGRRSG